MFSKITILLCYNPSNGFRYGSFMRTLRKLSRDFKCNLSVNFSGSAISVSFDRSATGDDIPVLDGAALFHNVIAFVEVIAKENDNLYGNLKFDDVKFYAPLPF